MEVAMLGDFWAVSKDADMVHERISACALHAPGLVRCAAMSDDAGLKSMSRQGIAVSESYRGPSNRWANPGAAVMLEPAKLAEQVSLCKRSQSQGWQ